MTTTTNVPTATQPDFHVNNILDHPGSTWAGVGVAALTVGNAVQAGSMPTTTSGWISFLAGLAFSVAAALGK